MDLFGKLYNKSLRFLSYRPRSEKEVRENLSSKGRSASGRRKISPKIIDQVINKLKEQKFLNDEEFTKWWIEQRTKFRPRGLQLIKIELRQKGISVELIESGIKNPELEREDDTSVAKKLVEKKIGKYKGLPKEELYQKLGGFLARRGFSWDTIKQSIDEVIKEGV